MITTRVLIAFYSRGRVTKALAKAIVEGAEVALRRGPLECRH